MPSIKTNTLEIHYLDEGVQDGWTVVLTHGFPYDIHAYDDVVPILTKAGARCIRPYVRGFGPTRFLSSDMMRTGQQAALASDVIGLLDALSIDKAILAGFDWGGVASCTATALFPERINGLVCYASYDVMDVAGQRVPAPPALEAVMWYQHLFQTQRGKVCLETYRRDLCRLLWQQWSPSWKSEHAFEITSPSFDNPDFVAVVIHAYRFLFGLEKGDAQYEEIEKKLAQKPKIVVPAITLDGTQDPLKPGGTASHAEMFAGRHEHRVVECGHNLPQEKPTEFADAILTLHGWLEGPGLVSS